MSEACGPANRASCGRRSNIAMPERRSQNEQTAGRKMGLGRSAGDQVAWSIRKNVKSAPAAWSGLGHVQFTLCTKRLSAEISWIKNCFENLIGSMPNQAK